MWELPVFGVNKREEFSDSAYLQKVSSLFDEEKKRTKIPFYNPFC